VNQSEATLENYSGTVGAKVPKGLMQNTPRKMASSGSKVSLGCWPISQSIGRELEQKLQLLYVFNCGKSAILSTVDNKVYSVGLNPSGALGTGASQQCIFSPTKIREVTGRLMYMYSSPVKCTSHLWLCIDCRVRHGERCGLSFKATPLVMSGDFTAPCLHWTMVF